jgi:T5SS/PEP-CTERM-associated repeat protein
VPELVVGQRGSGEFHVTNGAHVVIDDYTFSSIGQSEDSIGWLTLDGPGTSMSGQTALFVGDSGNGTLRITRGAHLTNSFAMIADSSHATGAALVDGPDSLWDCSTGELDVGFLGGPGSLTVSHSALVKSQYGNIGPDGRARIDASAWNMSDELYMDSGVLAISHGATVTAVSLEADPGALITLTTGDGSSFSVGPNTFTNDGIIRLTAAPSAIAGNTYAPISAPASASWGTVQALGGTWNPVTHTFTVSTAATGNAGSPVNIDLSQQQRIVITDPASSKSVIANFLASATPASLTLTAAPLDGAALAALQATLPADQSLLTGWTFTPQGYTQGGPVYLSIAIGPDQDGSALHLWHYDGAIWTPYDAADLTYDNAFASFTVNGFSSYAVTATTVPEPATLTILGWGVVAFATRRRRR